MDPSSVKNNRIFSLYAACTQVKMCHIDKWEDPTPAWHSKMNDARTDMLDSKQHCNIGNDAPPKNIIMRSSQDSTKGDIRTRSEWVSHRPERLGIDI